MFATAVRLLARKSTGPKPVKLSELGDGVQPAMESLFNILKDHGPLTVQDCWKHASQVMNAPPSPPSPPDEHHYQITKASRFQGLGFRV
jgi:hypothetical protein